MPQSATFSFTLPSNNRNQRQQAALIDDLFQLYSKLLFIRVDFYLRKEHDNVNNYHNLNNAFTRLRNNMRFNSLFDHYITYCAKLEYGPQRGWHFHALFFFDGQKVQNDYLLAQAIGEYWGNVVTGGLGHYYSANMNRDQYQHFAMGPISYYQVGEIEAAKAAAAYLTKPTIEYPGVLMRDNAGKLFRSYRQGQLPSKSQLGRPRQHTR